MLGRAGRTCMDCIRNRIKFQTPDCLPVKDTAKIQMSDNQEGGPHQIAGPKSLALSLSSSYLPELRELNICGLSAFAMAA